MKKTELDKSRFMELSTLVRYGLEEDIDKWFKKYIKDSKELESDLTSQILNSVYFFSFSIDSIDKSHIENESIKRELMILKRLSLKNQLALFAPTVIDTPKYKHFEALKVTKESFEDFTKEPKIIFAITKLFHMEKFDDLDKITKLFNHNFLEQKSNMVIFNYVEDYTHGSFFTEIKEPLFSPKYNLAISYSDNKMDYLNKYNIPLPTVEEIEIFHKELLGTIQNDPWLDKESFKEKINLLLTNYIPIKSHLDLEKNLQVNTKTNTKLKV